ncbi:MAG: right-handed parallel beta-helix repeat-containing protein, partial [Candidatus Stygibacter australis]|nr:right-handed parallel beta-helix repeat-containing protein [Candidatus Stygibacter australis]
MKVFLALFVIISIPIMVFGTLIEIDDDGGLDFSSIQAGIDNSVSGDTLLVHPGLYQENINYGGRDIVVVSLYYTTGDSSYIENTIIGDVVDGCLATFENYETRAAVLGGFTLRGGTGSNFPNYLSGGISCLNFSSPTLRDLNIHDNNRGAAGGIYCEYSDPLIENCHIHDNTEPHIYYGGGITLYHSNAEISGCLIENNYGQVCGGGICVFEMSDAFIENTIISGNIAEGGGGIYAQACNLTLRNVLLSNNDGRLGGGIVLYYYVNPDFENVVIKSNECGSYGGAGMYLNTLDCEIQGVKIIDNYGHRNVGMFVRNSEVTLKDFVICNNYIDYENLDGSSMKIDNGSEVIIENTTFQGNISYGTSMIIAGSSSLIMRNSIFADDGMSIQFQESDAGNDNYLELSYCNIVNGESSLDCDNYGSYVWGAGNISEEVGFACLEEEDWRLMYYSPCIDAGDPEGEYDPDGTIQDMGAIYYDQTELVYPEINIPDYLHFESGEVIELDFEEYVYDINPDELTLSVNGNEDVLVDIADMLVTISCTYNWAGVEFLTFYVNDNSGRLVSSAEMTVDVSKNLIYVPEEFAEIQTAIEQANIDSTKIIVAPGEYHENLDFLGKNIELVSYFAATGDTAFISDTIIDGDSLDSVILLINCSWAKISGFTIRNGYGWDSGAGGIFIDGINSIQIDNSILENNEYSAICGGLTNNINELIFHDLIIRNNTCSGIYIDRIENAEISDLYFSGNQTYYSSSNYFSGTGENSVIYMDNVNVNYFNQESSNDLLYIGGFSNSVISNINIKNVDIPFESQSSALRFAGISNSTISDVTINNFQAISNYGGLRIDDCSDVIFNNIIVTDCQSDLAAGMKVRTCRSEPVIIYNSLIQGNVAVDRISAISLYKSNVYFINCTITGNVSENGAAINNSSNASEEPYFINCIIYDNEPAQIQLGSPTERSKLMHVEYCDVEGGEEGVLQYEGAVLHWEEGNIDADPLFTGIEPYLYSLEESSPCVDVGTLDFPILFEVPETDLAGNPRISGDFIDMGCYEYQYPGGSEDAEIVDMSGKVWCYPNPFNPEVTISFSTTEVTENTEVNIYNVKGQRVRELNPPRRTRIENSIHRGGQECKMNSVVWDGKDDSGKQVS